MELERKVLPLIFVLTGTCNVIIAKWSDNLEAECSDGKVRYFQHPVVQTLAMFLGELLCYLAYKTCFFFLERRGDGSENWNLMTRGNRSFSFLSLLIPAALDTLATFMLFTGLYLTYVSSFQMLRSSAIIFVCIFNSIQLNQRLTFRHWMALFTITCGIVILLAIDVQRVEYDKAALPLNGSLTSNENAVLTGNLLVICSQILQALQLVYMDKQLKTNDMSPMHAVGWQGIFGVIFTIILGTICNFLPTKFLPFGNNTHGVLDDIADSFYQMHANKYLIIGFLILLLSSAIFNYAAHSIIKFSSSSNCLLADQLRVMLIVWLALVNEWEYLNLFSIAAFVIIAMGTVAYRNAIFLEWYRALLARMFRNRYMDVSADPGAQDPDMNSRSADAV